MKMPEENAPSTPPESTDSMSIDRAAINQAIKLPSQIEIRNRLTGKVSDEHLNKILWLVDHARQKAIYTIKATAALISYDSGTLSKVLSAQYPANLDNVIKRIDDYRRMESERQGYGDTPIVTTSLSEEITTFCEVARSANSMAYLTGISQIGKSTTLRQYANNPEYGRTFYVEMPVGGVTRTFLLDLARGCGINSKTNAEDLKSRLHRFIDRNCLLIVDEFHQALICGLKKRTIETIRRIHDVTGCGVVLCGTDVLHEHLADEKNEKFLAQILKRAPLRKALDPEPTEADLQLICTAYGFPTLEGEGGDTVRRMAVKDGLGPICKYLRLARKLAHTRKVAPAWEHFLTTVAMFAAPIVSPKKKGGR